jgi:signal transduction histidine kinase
LRLIADVIATARARRRAELDAQRSRQEIAQMARRSSMGELASALAHQLNQPLAAIMANAQAAQRLIESGTPQAIDIHEDSTTSCRIAVAPAVSSSGCATWWRRQRCRGNRSIWRMSFAMSPCSLRATR